MLDYLTNETGVYCITNLVNGKVWVGQSQAKKGIKSRCQGHVLNLRKGKGSRHLQAAWDKYGSDAFEFATLRTCAPEECDTWENYFIQLLRSSEREYGYNIAKLARGPGRMSQETKERIGASQMGRKRIPDSPEVNSARALALKGRKKSEETRKKMSEAKRNMTQETKDRISAAKRKKFKTDENSATSPDSGHTCL